MLTLSDAELPNFGAKVVNVSVMRLRLQRIVPC